MKIKYYFKIILILIFTFVLSGFVGDNIFIGQSSRLRPNLIAYFSYKLKTNTDAFLAKLVMIDIFPKINHGQFFTQSNVAKQNNDQNNQYQLTGNQVYDNLVRNLKPVAKGVEAATYKNYSYVKVNFAEIEWEEIELIKMDGTKMKVRVPKEYK